MQQALQNQLYGGQASAWNFGAAYRIPDTNINLSGTYQQGKANLQVKTKQVTSCWTYSSSHFFLTSIIVHYR